MKPRSRIPLPRLGNESLLAAAGAAGFAQACAYESGTDFDAAAVARWKERQKRSALRILPSGKAWALGFFFSIL